MHLRSILTGIIPLLLGGTLATACDAGKSEAKPDANKADAKAADAKAGAADAKAAEPAPEPAPEPVAEEAGEAAAAEAGDAEAADAAEPAEAGEPAEAADDDAEEGAEPEKAEPETAEPEADPKKAEPKKADPKKADPKKADPPKTADAGPKIDGKGLYLKKCKSCHGVSGNADTKLGKKHEIEDWTKPGWKAKWSHDKIVAIVTNGEPNTKMKSFKTKLTAEEIEAVAVYSRKLGK